MISFLLEADAISEGLVLRNAPANWVIFLVILPAILAFTVLFYRMGRTGVPRPVRFLLTTLRLLVLLFVLFLLMDPALQTRVVEKQPSLVVLLADTSASMSHKDQYERTPELEAALRTAARVPAGTPMGSIPRFDLLRDVLSDPADPIVQQLKDERRLRMYSFGERLQTISSLDDLVPTGRVTRLGETVQRILDEPELKSSNVGGVVLFSDGKNTAGPTVTETIELASRRRIPIHTIGVGDPTALRDIELLSAIYPSVVLVDDTITFDLRIRQRGFDGQEVPLVITERGQPIHRQRIQLAASDEPQPFRILHRASTTGWHQWKILVGPEAGEHTIDNNSKDVEVHVKDSRVRVLYVESTPRYEYRFLKDFLRRSPDSFLTNVLLLDADRGFPQEVTEGVGLESLRRFPETFEELNTFDVILFGDVDVNSELFSGGDPEKVRALLENIRRFVDEGGGFGMIAGGLFSPRIYKDTAIGDLLPIIIDPSFLGIEGTEYGFKTKLTPDGLIHPITRIDDREEDPDYNRKIWEDRSHSESLPGMRWFCKVRKAKPGASVLAVHESERSEQGLAPLLVVGTYGLGPVFFTALDETWFWYGNGGPFAHHRYWGNVVRYLARARLYQGDRRFRLESNRTKYLQGSNVTLTAYVKDRVYRPSMDEFQEVILEYPEAAARRETLRLRRVRPGVFEHSFQATTVGPYRSWIPSEDVVTDDKLSPIAFSVEMSDVELTEPILDEAALKEIAAKTGGTYAPLHKAAEILREVSKGVVEITRQRRFTHLREEGSGWLQWLPILFL
ncbi:MAG TPA: hypothetical protein PKA37_09935, partial [Planctomycetota bacterium]|nr:hypothetical protein [Planctomycetota bacterium]